MLPGRFLGIASNVGDAFCYLILTQPDDGSRPQVLARSVIRKRYPREPTPEPPHELRSELEFFLSDGKTPIPEPDDIALQDIRTAMLVTAQPPAATSAEEPDDELEAMVEVYGPPNKRARYTSPTSSSVDNNNEMPHSTGEYGLRHSSVALSDSPAESPSVSADASVVVETVSEETDLHQCTSEDRPLSYPITQEEDEDHDPDLSDQVAQGLDPTASEDQFMGNFDDVVGHEFREGILHMKIAWRTGTHSFHPFPECREDFPYETAKYLVKANIGLANGTYTSTRYTRWARGLLRRVDRVTRRVFCEAGATLGDTYQYPKNIPNPLLPNASPKAIIRRHKTTTPNRTKRKKTKPGRIRRPLQVKYGIEIPHNITTARILDEKNGDTAWIDAVRKEVSTLLELKCFEIHGPDYKPGRDFKFVPLQMIFEAKQCGQKKARLVAGGHIIDPGEVSCRSTVVKGISSRLLDLIAHRDGLTILCGDVGNAFITAPTHEKVYTVAGQEFGDDLVDSVMIIRKALYGLRGSSRAFRAHFADYLRKMGFVPTRYDRDVWMRAREENDGYDYICTHVDDFKIVAKDPARWADMIASIFSLKEIGPPKYYLGNDYRYDERLGAWAVNANTYIKECLRRIQDTLSDDEHLVPQNTPLPEGCHPKLDASPLLPTHGIRRYQALIGMAQWACTIGRLDICFALSSLSRFSTTPREGHLQLALHLFGYLKKYPTRGLVMDSRPLRIDEEILKDSFHPDFLEDYSGKEEYDPSMFPTPFGDDIATTVMFDADHAHDHVTRRSVSGIIVFVGSTPVAYSSKRQGCIATSTYCAEFLAMRSATEEAISIRYMLRCLGIPVTAPSNLIGDNFGVIQSATIPASELKKKHVAISYHYVREAISQRVVNGIWCKSTSTYSDACTKALGAVLFNGLIGRIMYP